MRGDPHVRFQGDPAERPADAHPTRGTEKLIEYKTYLQALPFSDRSEGDRGHVVELDHRWSQRPTKTHVSTTTSPSDSQTWA
ncbi:NADH dehydrogenase [ubiquinone] iron-sulfur protein 2 [Platanthera zijinensis]|uniref:NADH dehydrogenase [ubiquinone] iron-sulfur protein 2 n=1 Tax=Platanthera zijinensis TaxID=2320716 RepID=A0AAP0BH72_9ASPA